MKILRFRRHDGFRELFLSHEAFSTCRDELEKAGLSIDLSSKNLGNGKLVVPDPELAKLAIIAIKSLGRQLGRSPLVFSDVIVSSDMEKTVRFVAATNKVRDRENTVRNIRFLIAHPLFPHCRSSSCLAFFSCELRDDLLRWGM